MVSSDVSLDVALADASSLKGLSARESELVQKAGERVFELSRRLAEREREIDRLKLELAHVRGLLEETVRSREVLSNQVMSLQTDADRNFDERSELRELLARAQGQLQELVNNVVVKRLQHEEAPAALPAPSTPGGRQAPQRRARRRRSQGSIAVSNVRKWLANR